MSVKVKKAMLLLLTMLLIFSSLIVCVQAYNYSTYTSYDATVDFSGSRTWSSMAGNIRVKATFDNGNLVAKDSMTTGVSTSNWNTKYTVFAKSHIQTKNHNYYTSYGDTTTSTSSCSVKAGLWETTQFALHYGYFQNSKETFSRYFKGMLYYEGSY